MESREEEVHGKWLTEDRLKKLGQFSPVAIKNIIQYCTKFPETLVRPGRFHVGPAYACLQYI